MRRHFPIPLLILALFLCCAEAVPPEGDPAEAVEVYVDGARVNTEDLAVREDGVLWAPLRLLSDALGAREVNWDEGTQTATVTAPGLTVAAPVGSLYITANDRYFYAPGGVKLLGGRVLVPLASLVKAFGATFEEEPNGVLAITSGTAPIEPGDSFYNEEDVYWLSRIIYAEAGAEPFAGQIAIGNVVMDRTLDPNFPSTVKEVIFDRRYGIQFTPAYSDAIYMTPSNDSVIAAKLALEGEYVVHALYFASRQAAETCWAARHRQVVAELWGSVFFA